MPQRVSQSLHTFGYTVDVLQVKPDFTISVLGSSCNSLIFVLILSSFFFVYLFLGIPS